MTLANRDLAELLRLEADRAEGPRAEALRRAARAALLWPVEASALLAGGRSLTELEAVGPALARLLQSWLESGRQPPEPPPVRRGFLTLAEARATLAADPGALPALQGDLQAHTTHSDGAGTVEEMARAAAARGYAYLAITDHSKGLRVARGMDEERLAAQGREVRAVQERLRAEGASLTLLHGIELNLDQAGEGDMDPGALGALDVVLGAFHTGVRSTEDQTPRYLAALANPHVHVLAHPRCRMYDRRVGLVADWPTVFACAAEAGKAVEVDAFPDRQDLDVELLALARESGCWISIGTDAHHPDQLAFVELGLAAVLRAGVPRERVLNFLPLQRLRAWLAGRAW